MSDIDFNSKVSSSDASRETEAEREVKDQKKAELKAVAFRQAMQRAPAAPGAPSSTHAPATPAAMKQSHGAAGPHVKAPADTLPAQAASQMLNQSGVVQAASGKPTQATSAASLPATSEGPATLAGISASNTAGAGESSGVTGGHDSSSPLAPAQAAHQQSDAHAGGDGGGRDANKQSLASLMREAAGHDRPLQAKAAPGRDAPASRIDLASIVPSFPVPMTPAAAAAAAATPASSRPLLNTDLIQQIVQYAMVTQNAQGQSEFHLGLGGATLAGIGVHLTACGRRRVRVRFTGLGDGDAISESDINTLVESLRARNVEVAEVLME